MLRGNCNIFLINMTQYGVVFLCIETYLLSKYLLFGNVSKNSNSILASAPHVSRKPFSLSLLQQREERLKPT